MKLLLRCHKAKLTTILVMLLLLLFCGCGKPKKLVLGMIPSETPQKLEQEFQQMKLYLEKELNVEIEFFVPGDYKELVKSVSEGTVDIALFGPFSYVLAEYECDLDPLLVRSKRTYGTSYNSTIIVPVDSKIENVADLEGKRFAFVNSASTSGCLIPSALFKSRDIETDTFFDYYFAGTHDTVILDVLSGKADAGACANTIFKRLSIKGAINPDDFRIIWKSDSIPGSPFVARADLDGKTKEAFQKALLEVDSKDPNALNAFDSSIEKYVPAKVEMYDGVRKVVNILGRSFFENVD